ncbi:FRG domain-containing protein [Cystobacter fuscus]
MKTVEVSNVHEAVALAEKWKSEGRYDWFRGQRRNWPLKSSIARLDADGRARARKQLGRFRHWVANTPGLEAIAASEDAMGAVAQHYGLATSLVDFSTEPRVAGFFATHREKVVPEQLGCIICLNTADFREVCAAWPQAESLSLELLRLPVPNLWRLEAQAGVFLLCPYENLEGAIYDMDRILFPQTGKGVMSEAEIYPERKSQLEILLDHYFFNEGRLGVQEQLDQSKKLIHIRFDPPSPSRCDDRFLKSEPELLASWDGARLTPWLQHAVEAYSDARCMTQFVLDIGPVNTPVAIREQVATQVLHHLSTVPGLRRHLVDWQVTSLFVGSAVTVEADAQPLSQRLGRVWDGMRGLPYEDKDVALALGTCVALAVASQLEGSLEEGARLLFGAPVRRIEFGVQDSSFFRAYVSETRMLAAVRADLTRFFHPERVEPYSKSLTGILMACQAPQRVFEFDALVRLFAHEIIPSQIFQRSVKAPVLYSPARLEGLGLP